MVESIYMTRIPGIIGQYVTAGGPTGLHTAYTHYIHQTPTPATFFNNEVKQKNRLKRYYKFKPKRKYKKLLYFAELSWSVLQSRTNSKESNKKRSGGGGFIITKYLKITAEEQGRKGNWFDFCL